MNLRLFGGLLFAFGFHAAPVFANCPEELEPAFYEITYPEETFPSGFKAPPVGSSKETELFRSVKDRLRARGFRNKLKQQVLRTQLLWLHEFAYMQSYRGRAELMGNISGTAGVQLPAKIAKPILENLTMTVLNHPLPDLAENFGELKTLVTDLAIASGGRDASMMIQTQLVVIAEQTPDLNRFLSIIYVGMIEDLRSIDALSPRRIAKFIDTFPKLMNYMQPSQTAKMITMYIAEALRSNDVTRPPWRDLLRAYMTLMEKFLEPEKEKLDEDATRLIREALRATVEFANFHPGLLTADQLRSAENFLDEISGFRNGRRTFH